MSAPYMFAAGFAMAVLIMAALLYVVYTRRRSRKPPPNIKGYLDLIPDLSEEQRQKVQEIRRLFLPKVNAIRENLRSERAELARLLFREPTDRNGIHAITKQILDHQSELEREVIEHILEEKEMLSSSQKQRFYEIIVEQFSSGGLGVHDVKGKFGS